MHCQEVIVALRLAGHDERAVQVTHVAMVEVSARAFLIEKMRQVKTSINEFVNQAMYQVVWVSDVMDPELLMEVPHTSVVDSTEHAPHCNGVAQPSFVIATLQEFVEAAVNVEWNMERITEIVIDGLKELCAQLPSRCTNQSPSFADQEVREDVPQVSTVDTVKLMPVGHAKATINGKVVEVPRVGIAESVLRVKSDKVQEFMRQVRTREVQCVARFREVPGFYSFECITEVPNTERHEVVTVATWLEMLDVVWEVLRVAVEDVEWSVEMCPAQTQGQSVDAPRMRVEDVMRFSFGERCTRVVAEHQETDSASA